MHLSTIVMAYNEQEGLGPTVRELIPVLEAQNISYEVLVVDDGSTDGTPEVCRSLQAEFPHLRVLRHQPNQGLGAVYRTGLAEARGDWLTFVPADGQLPPSNLPRFLAKTRDYDLLLGILTNRKRSLLGSILSAVERLLYRFLFGRFPPFQGLFMVRRELTLNLSSQSTRGWGIVMELILRSVKRGARWTNVPTELHPRLSGQSKVQNLRTIWANLRDLWRLRGTLR